LSPLARQNRLAIRETTPASNQDSDQQRAPQQVASSSSRRNVKKRRRLDRSQGNSRYRDFETAASRLSATRLSATRLSATRLSATRLSVSILSVSILFFSVLFFSRLFLLSRLFLSIPSTSRSPYFNIVDFKVRSRTSTRPGESAASPSRRPPSRSSTGPTESFR